MSASHLSRCHLHAIRSDAGASRGRSRRVGACRAHGRRAGDVVSSEGAEDDVVVDRRRALALGLALAATTSAPPPALAQALLSERLERRDLSKPVFNKAKPGPTRYPPWLEGTWRCTATFAGFEFPSKTMSKNALIKEPTIPGFQKLSLAYVPDVGTPEIVYDVRFAKFEGIEGVLEDRAFNLKSIVNAYLGKDAVSSVEYEPMRDANRTTVNIKPGASPNAERIELFANARESETRRTDGTFFASEASRQVTLGYGRDFGTARVVNTDYQHVWTFTPVFSEGGAEGGAEEGAVNEGAKVNEVKVTLSTAGYVQANDALRFTAAPNAQGGAPMPSLGGAAGAAFEPAVLYSHTMTLRRV